MEIDSNTILVSLISVFLVLTITSAGMSLNDEWMTAAQLSQLYQGHQIVYNEGKYGYFMNGTPGAYMEHRHNILMYSMALPVIALPAMMFLSLLENSFRAGIFAIWAITGIMVLYFIIVKRGFKYTPYLAGMLAAVYIANLILYTSFPFSGLYIPGEVAALVLTNILLFGILSAIVFVTSKELFGNNLKAWYATGVSIVCSSLIFWAGTTKDHVLTALLVAIITLMVIKFVKQRKMKFIMVSAALAGLLTWVRPEIGIGIMLAVVLCAVLFTYHYGKKQVVRHVAIVSIILVISLAPFFANNFIVTGDPTRTAFMASNAGYDNYLSFNYYTPPNIFYQCQGDQCSRNYYICDESGLCSSKQYHEVGIYIYKNIPHLILNPESGAAGLFVIVPLMAALILGIPEMLRKKFIAKEKFWLITYPERVLLIMAIAAMAFHIYKGTVFTQQSDFGIFPDLRYFTPMYGAITLMSLSMLTRTFEPNIKKMIKNTMVISLLMVVMLVGAVAIFPQYFAIQSHFNKLMTEVVIGAIGLSAILIIQDMRNNTRFMGSIIIPLLVSVPFAWNLITTFIYTGTKMAGYPMLLPLSQFIYNMMFVMP